MRSSIKKLSEKFKKKLDEEAMGIILFSSIVLALNFKTVDAWTVMDICLLLTLIFIYIMQKLKKVKMSIEVFIILTMFLNVLTFNFKQLGVLQMIYTALLVGLIILYTIKVVLLCKLNRIRRTEKNNQSN